MVLRGCVPVHESTDLHDLIWLPPPRVSQLRHSTGTTKTGQADNRAMTRGLPDHSPGELTELPQLRHLFPWAV